MTRTHVSGSEPITVGPRENLAARVKDQAERNPGRPVLAIPGDGDWRHIHCAEFARRVEAVAAGLIGRGVGPGDPVAIMSPTRLEWTIADLAILSAGAVTVPLYDTSSAEQSRQILSDAGVHLAFAATPELADRLTEGGARDVFVFDDGGLEELADDGEEHLDEVEQRTAAITHDDLATIVYTSGTTGAPKGCLLTHGNLIWTTRQARAHLDEVVGGGGSMLQFLPLAHIFARVIQFVCLDGGLLVGYSRSQDDVPDDLRSFRPTFLLGVPRVFEKFFETAKRQATGVKRPLFNFAVSSGHRWARADDPGPWLRGRRRLADLLVYRRLRTALGGRVTHCIVGGAPLSRELAQFFLAAKVPVLEGYGLTETTAPAAANTPSRMRIGTVGTPLPGVEIRIVDDEVQVRGGNVFQGYHGRDDEDDFDGDWFRTGDLGMIDDDGYLTLRDRKKDLIVTASGKNVAPTPLEEQIASHDLIAQAMLVGDQQKFVGALIALDEDGLREFADKEGLTDDPQELRQNDRVRHEIKRAVNEANAGVSRAESVREFVIVERQFTEEDGELTPTLKYRRRDIADHFADEIESIYS